MLLRTYTEARNEASHKRNFYAALCLYTVRAGWYSTEERRQHTRLGVRARLTVYRLNGFVLFGNYRGGVADKGWGTRTRLGGV